MSNPIRVALAVEGPTDSIVLRAAIRSLLAGREVVFSHLQPLLSVAFQPLSGGLAGGWGGVYCWCRQAASEGRGRVLQSEVFVSCDVLVVQVDADVAGMTYASANIDNPPADLPCVMPCPPPRATTDALRAVILGWMGEAQIPPRCVLCTPSKNMEAWVMQALFPTHKQVARADWECRPNPEAMFGQIRKGDRVTKSVKDYRTQFEETTDHWPAVRQRLSEASRFATEFLNEVPLVNNPCDPG